MPTHKANLRQLSQVELSAATGCSRETVRRRLAQPPSIEPCRRDGKTVWYSTAEALRRILGPTSTEGAEVLDLAAERAALARAQTEGQTLKNAATTGAMIPAAEAEATWARYILTCKERLRAIPNASLTRIPGMTKPMARELAVLIDEALTELGSAHDGVPKRPAPRRQHRKMNGSAAHGEANTEA